MRCEEDLKTCSVSRLGYPGRKGWKQLAGKNFRLYKSDLIKYFYIIITIIGGLQYVREQMEMQGRGFKRNRN
jgi:hypothetical protein